MYFSDLQAALLENVRMRVRNGDVTERGLAKLVGVSQPHIHNVLKGKRMLTLDLADGILQHLHISVLDLVRHDDLSAYHAEAVSGSPVVYVPLLDGRLGPGHGWPAAASRKRVAVPARRTRGMTSPVVVELAADPRMENAFAAGDFALLDQSPRARSAIDLAGLYVIRTRTGGIVRRLRSSDSQLYIVAEDALTRPSAWERMGVDWVNIQHTVRARALLLSTDFAWSADLTR